MSAVYKKKAEGKLVLFYECTGRRILIDPDQEVE